MAVLEGPDFKISRGGMPPDPPRCSRLPALGPLFTNFRDPPLEVRADLSLTELSFLVPSCCFSDTGSVDECVPSNDYELFNQYALVPAVSQDL